MSGGRRSPTQKGENQPGRMGEAKISSWVRIVGFATFVSLIVSLVSLPAVAVQPRIWSLTGEMTAPTLATNADADATVYP